MLSLFLLQTYHYYIELWQNQFCDDLCVWSGTRLAWDSIGTGGLRHSSCVCQNSQLLSWNKANCSFISIWQGELDGVLIGFLYYLYNYYMVCALYSHTHHMTSHVTPCDMTCDPVTCDMWHLWHDTFLHSFLCSKYKRKRKEKEKKYK